MELPLLPANNMLSVQLLVLDAGLLLTLYLGWRLAQQWAARAGRALLLLLPWATIVAVDLRSRSLDPAPAYADARHDNESMKALRPLAAVFILGMWATAARGDGGTMLLHQDSGPSPSPSLLRHSRCRWASADLSVMVQDRSSGDVLLDPAVDLTVAPEAADASPQTVRLTSGQASNRLLQAATVHFPTRR